MVTVRLLWHGLLHGLLLGGLVKCNAKAFDARVDASVVLVAVDTSIYVHTLAGQEVVEEMHLFAYVLDEDEVGMVCSVLACPRVVNYQFSFEERRTAVLRRNLNYA